MVLWHRWPSHAHWCDVESAVRRFTVPCQGWNSLAHLRNDESAVPSLACATVAAGGGQQWLTSAPAAVGGKQKCLGIVAQWRWRRGGQSCLWIVGHPLLAHRWRGWRWRGLMAGAVVVVQAMAGAMARDYWPLPCLLVQQRVGGGAYNSVSADIGDQRRAEGEILGEDFRLDGPPMFELGGV